MQMELYCPGENSSYERNANEILLFAQLYKIPAQL